MPPPPSAVTESPALTVKLPPELDAPVPTVNRSDPALSPNASPVCKERPPDAPTDAEPVDTLTTPLSAPALDATTTAPLVSCALDPLRTVTSPPDDEEEAPPATATPPPTNAEPATTLMDPATPAELSPVTIVTEPDAASVALPLARVTPPLEKLADALLTCTAPLAPAAALELEPLCNTTEPDVASSATEPPATSANVVPSAVPDTPTRTSIVPAEPWAAR
jgi:hypothetical protein